MDLTADQLGLDPVALRRWNISPPAFPALRPAPEPRLVARNMFWQIAANSLKTSCTRRTFGRSSWQPRRGLWDHRTQWRRLYVWSPESDRSRRVGPTVLCDDPIESIRFAQTPRWRESDSNFRFGAKLVRFSWSRCLASASSRRPAEGLRRAIEVSFYRCGGWPRLVAHLGVPSCTSTGQGAAFATTGQSDYRRQGRWQHGEH